MRRIILLASAVGLGLAVSCGPKPESGSVIPAPTTAARPAPSNLVAIAGNSGIELRWRTNQPENRILSGFNIYQAREDGQFQKITPLPYPGDLEADFEYESFSAASLENGVIYRFTVSTVYPDGSEVPSRDTVSAIPRSEGGFRLAASFKGGESGFVFARSTSVPTDDLANDIYLAVIKGRLHLASPSRIDDILRATQFYPVRVDPGRHPTQPKQPNGAGEELVAVRAGDELIVLTADGCYALVTIESADEDAETVRISYRYQSRRGSFSF